MPHRSLCGYPCPLFTHLCMFSHHVGWQPFGHPEGIFPWGHLDVWLLDNKGKELGQRLSLPMVHDAAALNWACNGTDRMYVLSLIANSECSRHVSVLRA